MKINKIQINRFGKFENFSLDFADGCNIIYGNNEDGKTTIMAFIKMMFYGSTGKSGDLSKNIRKKYMPWDGAKMSGAVEFSDKGITYRIERIFGATNTTDKINLWNTATGEKEMTAGTTDLGQRFFGIGAVAFEKSVFIGQAGSMVDTSADKDDEITQRLLNLVSTGDESVSQKKVDHRLKTAKEQLKSKGGKIGVLDKQYIEYNDLTDAWSNAKIEEEKKKQLEHRYNILAQQKKELQQSLQQNQSKYDLQDKLSRIQKLEQLMQKKQGIEKLIDECQDKKQQIVVGDTILDVAFIKNCEEKILQLQSLEEIYSERCRNARALEADDVTFIPQDGDEVSQEYVEQVKLQEKERLELNESIRMLTELIKKQTSFMELESQFSAQSHEKQAQENALQEVRAELESAQALCSKQKQQFEDKKKELNLIIQQQESANTQYQITSANIKHVEQLSNQKTEAATKALQQASVQRQVLTNEKNGRIINIPMLAIAVVILITSIALGFAVHPACFAGVALSVILGIVAFAKTKTKTVASTIVNEEEVEIAKQNLLNVQQSALVDNQAAVNAEKSAKDRFQELKIKLQLVQMDIAESERLYQSTVESVFKMQQQKNEIELNIKFIDEALLSLERDIKKVKLEIGELNHQGKQTDTQSLHDELNTQISKQTELISQINSLLSKKDCSSIDELQNKSIQVQSRQTKIATKMESITKAKENERQAKEDLEKNKELFIAHMNQYKPVDSYQTAIDTVQKVKEVIAEISTLEVRINSQFELLRENIEGKTSEQLLEEVTDIREQVLALHNGEMPMMLDEWQRNQLGLQLKSSLLEIQEVSEALARLNSDITSEFRNKKNVSQIKEEMRLLKKEIEERERHYQCLDIAQSTLLEAFTEIRQSFGPLLNEKTASIFNQLTDGKYHNVMISRNFDINVQDMQSGVSHEWQYLSSGTIDQAYLALRLAVADLLTRNSTTLPLMLDDVFLQYDDSRAEQGLRFLMNFSNSKTPTQIILFTCHKSVVDWAQKSQLDVCVKSISS